MTLSFYDLRGSIWFFLSRFYIVNGNYSDWGPYGECSKTCGGGVKTRKRTCTNPPPASGGADCSVLGPDTSTIECNIQECPGIMENHLRQFLTLKRLCCQLLIVFCNSSIAKMMIKNASFEIVSEPFSWFLKECIFKFEMQRPLQTLLSWKLAFSHSSFYS